MLLWTNCLTSNLNLKLYYLEQNIMVIFVNCFIWSNYQCCHFLRNCNLMFFNTGRSFTKVGNSICKINNISQGSFPGIGITWYSRFLAISSTRRVANRYWVLSNNNPLQMWSNYKWRSYVLLIAHITIFFIQWNWWRVWKVVRWRLRHPIIDLYFPSRSTLIVTTF